MELEINWCWGKWSFFKPPYSIFFEASCNIHDKNYSIWWNKTDRRKADLWLLKYMWRDVRKLPLYKRPYFYIWCGLYYFAVRLFGWNYFNYK